MVPSITICFTAMVIALLPHSAEAQGGSLNTFKANVTLTIDSDSSLSANQVAFRLLQSYNKWEDSNPNVCDPLQRRFTSVDLVKDTPLSRKLMREKALASVSLTELFISMTGACNNCETGQPIFQNDVSNRRKLQEACPPGVELRSPTVDEIIEIFVTVEPCEAPPGFSCVIDKPPDIFGLADVTDQTIVLPPEECEDAQDAFQAKSNERSFQLEPMALADMDPTKVSKALTTLTDPSSLVDLYKEFASIYCDPLHRQLEEAGFGRADFEGAGSNVVITLSYPLLRGRCNGCRALFDTNNNNNNGRRLRVGQRRLEECWCLDAPIARSPTRTEFETFLTDKFVEMTL